MEVVKFETAKLAKNNGYNGKSHYWFNQHGTLICKFKCGSEEDDYTVSIVDIEDMTIFNNYNTYPAPYQDDLSDWFRREHNIHFDVYPNSIDTYYPPFPKVKEWCFKIHRGTITTMDGFETYEKALEACLVEGFGFIMINK